MTTSLPPPWHFRKQRAIADYMLLACNSHDELVNLLLESRYSIGDEKRKGMTRIVKWFDTRTGLVMGQGEALRVLRTRKILRKEAQHD